MTFVAAKSKILEKIGFWFRKRPLLGISPGEKQSTFTPDFLADSRRWASRVKNTLHSFESLSARRRVHEAAAGTKTHKHETKTLGLLQQQRWEEGSNDRNRYLYGAKER